MKFSFKDTKIDYEFSSNAATVNVFLHGWGRSKEDFYPILPHLKSQNYLLLDFPPFGESEESIGWTIFTYANMVVSLIKTLKIKKVNLIGHSFGGRVAILVAGMEKDLVERLVLVDSAGMRPRKRFKTKLKILKFKLRKKLKLKTDGFGSIDYNLLSDNMKKTFTNIVNTHLEEHASLVHAKTMIIFGKNDKETPIYMAKRLNCLIKNSKLVLIENTGHFCFQERKLMFCKILNEFLEEG